VIERIVRFLNAVSFQRGLALGAIVGAAIAGSTLWTRLLQSRNLPSQGVPPPGDLEPD
jgi:hypothetical protein